MTPLEQEVKKLRHEVQVLRGSLIGVVGEDPEGTYRPEFVKDILRAREEKPTETFTDANSFLASLDEDD